MFNQMFKKCSDRKVLRSSKTCSQKIQKDQQHVQTKVWKKNTQMQKNDMGNSTTCSKNVQQMFKTS